jgi:dihydroneopterin aldolase/2-amino-4-hydroxy-6-hydroxymethyldihydropteridine diphosphokinase
VNDRILLHGLEFYGYHGVRPEETAIGQRFVVDVELRADLRAAGETDDLAQTVDYAAVHEDIRSILEGPPARLIETVAERVAGTILERYPVVSVRVRVKKPDVPIAGTLDYVAVEIERGLAVAPLPESGGDGNAHAADVATPVAESWEWGEATRAYLPLGSNLGDRLTQLVDAVRALSEASQVTTVSPIYETAALGADGELVDQPAFLNCAVAIDTPLSARDLLAVCNRIERSQGRNGDGSWEPRAIDVDVVLYGDAHIDTPELIVPHPRMHERAFVLRPLVNIDPALTANGLGALADLLPGVAHQEMRLHTSAAAFAVLIEGA